MLSVGQGVQRLAFVDIEGEPDLEGLGKMIEEVTLEPGVYWTF